MKVKAVVVLSLLALSVLQSAAADIRPDLSPDIDVDPEMLQYLDQLYNSAKELQRPLVNGELNLLPQDIDGFANSIRCFTGTNTFCIM